jgi:hypothetical protein
MSDRTYQEVFEHDWASIVCDQNGELIKDQVMRELSDYSGLMEDVSVVYNTFTNLSKPNTRRDVIIALIEEKLDQSYQNGYKAGLNAQAEVTCDLEE